LYRNGKFGISEASIWHLIISKIAFLFILLLWLTSALVYLDRKIFSRNLLSVVNNSLALLLCVVFVVSMYTMLDKRFITLEEAEAVINNPDRKAWIKSTKWIFSILFLIPLLILFAAGN
jgi:hypothetical protein